MPNPYASLTKTLPGTEPETSPDVGGMSTYGMTDASGKSIHAPLDSVGYWISQGYTLKPEEKQRHAQDYANKYKLAVVGQNAAGQPMYGEEPPSEGKEIPVVGQTWRYLKGAGKMYWDAATGMLHALTAPPQDEMEKKMAKGVGSLTAYRMTLGPMKAERQKAEQIKRDLDAKGQSIFNFANPDVQLYWKHRGIGQVPIFGPMVAGSTDVIGQSLSQGDVSGALGEATAAATMLRGGPKTAENVLKTAEATGIVPARTAAALRSELPYVPNVRRFATQVVPRKLINSKIKPSNADVKFGKDPTQAILDEGIVGNSLSDVGQAVNQRLNDVGKQLDALVNSPANAHKIVDVSSSLKPFDDAITEATKTGNRPLVRKLLEQRQRLTHEWNLVTLPSGRVVLRPGALRNMHMSPTAALEYKRWIGDQVKWTNEPLQGDMNVAFGHSYGAIKDALNNTIDGMKELNQRYADLVGARKAVTRREIVEGRNSELPLSQVILVGTGHIPLAVAKAVAELPAVKTRLAQGLYRMPHVTPAVQGTLAASYGAQNNKKPDQTAPAQANPYAALPLTLPPAVPAPTGPGLEPATQSYVNAAVGDDTNLAALTRAIILTEHSGPSAVSPKGAMGRMQLMPGTATDMGVTDPFNEEQNIQGGVKYLKQLLEKYNGDPSLAAAAYNAGPGAVDEARGVPNIKETRDYVGSVLGYLGNQAEANPYASLPPTMPPAPIQQVKKEAAARKPAAGKKKYTHVAVGPNNHQIGTNDGVTWFDVVTGEPFVAGTK